MSYADDTLHWFGATAADRWLLACYFTSDGSPKSTRRFVETVADCVARALPLITVVLQTYVRNPETMVEIWGVARG